MTLDATLIFPLVPHKAKVDVAVVGQVGAHEADVRNNLRVDLHQSKQKAQQHFEFHDGVWR